MLQLKYIFVLTLCVTSILGNDKLKCYTCKGDKECKEPGLPKECELGDTCTTIFDVDEGIIKGCSSDLKTECRFAVDDCYQCKSNKCNTATADTDYQKCIECNSKNNINCMQGTEDNKKKCNKSCMAQFVLDASKKYYNLIRTCLDDLEKAQQNECAEGKNKNCAACNTTKCNKGLLTENVLKCRQCKDSNCETPKLDTCGRHNETQQCYALYKKSDIIELGCSSSLDLTPKEIEQLKKNHEIIFCDGNDCNNLDNLPKRQQCRICNSKSDPKCAQNVKEMTSTTPCEIENELACYTRILDDKSTDRGCWKNLSEMEKLNCKIDTKTGTCSGCTGSECNNKIFPENRQRCHECNSTTDTNCTTNNPNKSKICLLYDENDQCISKLDNKTVYRGCTSNLNSCIGTDRNCRQCKMNDCNVIDFKNVIYDNTNYGLWQDLPLTCLTCYGDKCKDNKITNNKCNENYEDCMTVFNNEGVVIMRGCENYISLHKEQFCQQNPNLCINCKSDNCNIGNKLDEFVNCTYCGWPNSPSCMEVSKNNLIDYPIRQCYKTCMTALYPHHDIDNDDPAYNIIRTCTDDKLPDAQLNCTKSIDDENSLCLTCKNDKCNREEYPKNRKSCYMCNQVDNCKIPNLNKCPLYRNNDDCYYIYNTDQIVSDSGCKSSLTKNIINDLLNNNKISLCNDKECNSVENQPKDSKCIMCDSKDDDNCAINPNLIVNHTTICKAPNSKCFIRINKDQNTERGCLVSLKEEMNNCNSTSLCKVCGEGENCNNELYPEDRRVCQVCNSKDNPSCHNKPNSEKVCSQYIKDETCVSTYKNKTTERGCGQTLKCVEDKDKKACVICDKNNCNSVDLKKKNGSINIIGNFMIISLLSIGIIIFSK